MCHATDRVHSPDGSRSARTTGISTFMRLMLTSLSRTKRTTGPRAKYWKKGGWTRRPAPCSTIRMKRIDHMLWVIQKARKAWRRAYCTANVYMTKTRMVRRTPVKPARRNYDCQLATISARDNSQNVTIVSTRQLSARDNCQHATTVGTRQLSARDNYQKTTCAS